jgi:hypothetical protein
LGTLLKGDNLPGIRTPLAVFGIFQFYLHRNYERLGMGEKQEFWFNTRTNAVESGPQSLSLYRVGPFETFEGALLAVETIEARARAIREEDEEEDLNWKN